MHEPMGTSTGTAAAHLALAPLPPRRHGRARLVIPEERSRRRAGWPRRTGARCRAQPRASPARAPGAAQGSAGKQRDAPAGTGRRCVLGAPVGHCPQRRRDPTGGGQMPPRPAPLSWRLLELLPPAARPYPAWGQVHRYLMRMTPVGDCLPVLFPPGVPAPHNVGVEIDAHLAEPTDRAAAQDARSRYQQGPRGCAPPRSAARAAARGSRSWGPTGCMTARCTTALSPTTAPGAW